MLVVALAPCLAGASGAALTDTGYANVLYNSVSGLPTSEANDIAQTPDGFIWVGSYSGLIRYDGKEFRRLDASTGINNVNVLYVDKKGRLWIGTNDSGAAIYADGVFRFYAKKDGLKSNSVRCFAEDAAGDVVVGTTDGLSAVKPDGTLAAVSDASLPSRYISALAADSLGNICGLTSLGDIFTVDGYAVNLTIAYDETKYSMPLSLYYDGDDRLCIGTDGSQLLRATLAGGRLAYTTLSCAPLTNLNCVRRLGGRLWVCADNGIGFFGDDWSFQLLNDLPLTNSIDKIYMDYEENLWLASSRQGVLKITSNRFTDISRAAGLPDCVVNSTARRDGLLYVATDKGLYILDSQYRTVDNALTKQLNGVRVRCITKDRDDNLWFSTYGQYGLLRCDPQGNISTVTSAEGLSSSRVRSAIQLSDGSMAAATSNGVSIVQNGQVVRTYGEKDGLRNLEILTLCELPDGTLCIGTDGGGLYLVRNGAIDDCLSQEDGLLSDIILRIKYDSQNDGLWIVTGNSLAFYGSGKITNIPKFPYSNNFDVFLYGDDGIWVLASNGIYAAKRSALLSGDEISYLFYNYEDGLPSNITANSFSCADSDGTLYLCGSSGVFSTSTTQEVAYLHTPKIAIPDISADSESLPVSGTGEVSVGSGVSRVTINAHVLTYALHDPLIRYQLVGVDKQPITVKQSELGEISYTNLKGGDYRFEISVLDENSGEQMNRASLLLHKTKTFRETTLYIVLLALAVIALTALALLIVFRLRMQRVLRQHEETRAFMKQIIQAFAKAIDAKDRYTNGHSIRVAKYARMLAQELGMDEESVEEVHSTALLHDIGKIAVPDAILNKPGALTEEEYAVMKKHVTAGGDILGEITADPAMSDGATYHHERYDGSGYASGLEGEDIPYVARIISVADAFDAMNSKRPYRDPLPRERIVSELQKGSGKQFDPRIAAAMLRLIESGAVATDGNAAPGV